MSINGLCTLLLLIKKEQNLIKKEASFNFIILMFYKIQIQNFIKVLPLVIHKIHNHHNIYINTEVL